MFHSSIFTMASNLTPDEDEPMHPAGLDMTHSSLQEILDAEDVNVSTALPTVPLDATNPFINPNQTFSGHHSRLKLWSIVNTQNYGCRFNNMQPQQ